MGHLDGGGFVIAGQGIKAQVDTGRQHQAVVGERIAIGQGDGARLRIDLRGSLGNDGHASRGDLVIGELLRRQFAHARDHLVTERTGGKGLIWLDQADLKFWIKLPQRPRAAGTAEAAADHGDTRRALRQRWARQYRRRRRCGDAACDIPARRQARGVHGCNPEKRGRRPERGRRPLLSGKGDVLVLQRHRTDAFAGGREVGVEHRGRGDANGRFTDAAPEAAARHHDALHLWHRRNAH